MIEPPRLFSDPESEVERSLLSAGRSYRASERARRKVLAGVGLLSLVTPSSAAASTLGKVGVTKWAVAAALTVGFAVPTIHYLHQRSTAALAASPQGEPARAPLAHPVQPAGAADEAPSAAIAEASGVAPSAARALPRLDSKLPPLSAELGALDAARASLARGDEGAALSALDAYFRKFPRGKLSLEAEVLRIDALAKNGQTMAARQRALAFVKRHPDSMLSARVRALAGQ